jgi:hypothetical protein
MSYCNLGFVTSAPLAGNDEGHSVHAKTRNAELCPETHDLQNLSLYEWMGGIEIGLELVETDGSTRPSRPCRMSMSISDTRENDAILDVRRLLF